MLLIVQLATSTRRRRNERQRQTPKRPCEPRTRSSSTAPPHQNCVACMLQLSKGEPKGLSCARITSKKRVPCTSRTHVHCTSQTKMLMENFHTMPIRLPPPAAQNEVSLPSGTEGNPNSGYVLHCAFTTAPWSLPPQDRCHSVRTPLTPPVPPPL